MDKASIKPHLDSEHIRILNYRTIFISTPLHRLGYVRFISIFRSTGGAAIVSSPSSPWLFLSLHFSLYL